MRHGESELIISDRRGELLLSYKHAEGVIAYRISQHALERLSRLEQLVVTARDEILRDIEAGFKEETGELVLDREIFKPVAESSVFRPARARDGRSPRILVLSSRERFHVQAWTRGEHEDSSSVFRILKKGRARAWAMLRRECQAMNKAGSWDSYRFLVAREFSFHWCSLRLRFAVAIHPVVDMRMKIGLLFNQVLDFRRR